MGHPEKSKIIPSPKIFPPIKFHRNWSVIFFSDFLLTAKQIQLNRSSYTGANDSGFSANYAEISDITDNTCILHSNEKNNRDPLHLPARPIMLQTFQLCSPKSLDHPLTATKTWIFLL